MQVAGKGIPGRSLDDVRQHDEWYSEYLILKESKKKAIQEWKQNKEVFSSVIVFNSLKLGMEVIIITLTDLPHLKNISNILLHI